MESADAGRYLVASRTIQPSEVIIKEPPAVIGPKQISDLICLGCYAKTTGQYKCTACSLPLCNNVCPKSANHKAECKLISQSGKILPISKQRGSITAYQCITPLRFLNLRSENPDLWKTLMQLESHVEDRKSKAVYKIVEKNIVFVIREFLGIKEFDDETIQTVCGILDTNAYEVTINGSKIRAVYPNISYNNHSCRPNCKHPYNQNGVMELKAIRSINENEKITTTYSQVFWTTDQRRTYLKETKNFWCECERCQDPSEFGSNSSAVNCRNCDEYILPVSCSVIDSPWKCVGCNMEYEASFAKAVMEETTVELNFLSNQPPSLVERILERTLIKLPESNCRVVSIKYLLTQMYGYVEGFYWKGK